MRLRRLTRTLSHLPILTSTDVILDTNVCIELLNSPHVAAPRLGAAAVSLVPLMVIGELLFGPYHSQRIDENLQRIQDFADDARVLIPDWTTAAHFGQVRHSLITKGKTIPDDDMWIAAFALQFNCPLVTRDQHFDHVDGLQILRW